VNRAAEISDLVDHTNLKGTLVTEPINIR